MQGVFSRPHVSLVRDMLVPFEPTAVGWQEESNVAEP